MYLKLHKKNEHEDIRWPYNRKPFTFVKGFHLGGRWVSNPRPSVPQTDALTN